ncbi:hypothetical protein HRI_003181200 [Hibiscus trionum]|uniref:Uncharacterized protein n=1 Tax=Hibiscus trionum TaxID=183268 RepID=A0A9W7MCC0_HIBTR|nr:hypothetical protein HRI_003181200 [Hibiscus trionum]
MFSWLARIALACWRPVSRYVSMNKDYNNDNSDEVEEDSSSVHDLLLCCRDLENTLMSISHLLLFKPMRSSKIIVKLRLENMQLLLMSMMDMVALMLPALSLIISFKT